MDTKLPTLEQLITQHGYGMLPQWADGGRLWSEPDHCYHEADSTQAAVEAMQAHWLAQQPPKPQPAPNGPYFMCHRPGGHKPTCEHPSRAEADADAAL